MSDIADGLQELHNSGYLHCDLKTNNLLVKRIYHNGRLTSCIEGKIIDLGIAQKHSAPSNIPRKFTSEAYRENRVRHPHIAPEILKGLSGHTVASDIYALGYFIGLTGEMYKMSGLQDIGLKCISKRVEKRPSLAEVIEGIADLH